MTHDVAAGNKLRKLFSRLLRGSESCFLKTTRVGTRPILQGAPSSSESFNATGNKLGEKFRYGHPVIALRNSLEGRFRNCRTNNLTVIRVPCESFEEPSESQSCSRRSIQVFLDKDYGSRFHRKNFLMIFLRFISKNLFPQDRRERAIKMDYFLWDIFFSLDFYPAMTCDVKNYPFNRDQRAVRFVFSF